MARSRTGGCLVKCRCLLSPGGATGAAGGSHGQLPAHRWTLTQLLLPLLATKWGRPPSSLCPRLLCSFCSASCFLLRHFNSVILSASLWEIVNRMCSQILKGAACVIVFCCCKLFKFFGGLCFNFKFGNPF